jgi:phospholipid-binding lipoprotein MlaA
MPDTLTRVRLRLASLSVAVALLAGCAAGTNPVDPYEGFNRGVYRFNEQLDKAVLKPVAEGYRFVLHPFIRASVSNFFSNLNDVIVVLNNTLQGKFTTAYADFGRIMINSSLGILGLFDIASEAGIEKHDEDFGQTLGWWGVPDGPYIVLPFFGPSNGRDVVGRVGDLFSDPVTYIDPVVARNSLWGTRVVNRRAELLDASKVLETAALDPYEFVRDAYLQRRRNLIYDGKPPPERESPPPSKPKGTSIPQQFPTAAEPTGDGSRLVSGEAHAPVESAHASLPQTSLTDGPAEGARQTATFAQFWRSLNRNLARTRE